MSESVRFYLNISPFKLFLEANKISVRKAISELQPLLSNKYRRRDYYGLIQI